MRFCGCKVPDAVDDTPAWCMRCGQNLTPERRATLQVRDLTAEEKQAIEDRRLRLEGREPRHWRSRPRKQIHCRPTLIRENRR